MKKILLSLLFLLACAAAVKADDGTALVITFHDNTTQTFMLSTLPDIWMKDDKLTVKTAATTAEYALYTVKTFTFSSFTGIGAITSEKFSLSDDRLVVSGENAEARIFTPDGRAVACPVERTGGNTVVSLSALSHGVYILRVNGKSVKIKK